MVERRTRSGIADYQEPLIEHRGHLDPLFNTTFRPLAGAQQNNRGNARVVTLATFAGGPAQFVPSIVETPKNSGDDAEVVTIQLSQDLPESLNADGDSGDTGLEVVAVLEWGVGGSFYTADIDWNQGVAFAVCANVVRVSARVGPIASITVPDVNIVLHASMAYGNANSPTISSCIRRTLNLGSVPAGLASPIIDVPPWALGVTICDAGVVGGGGGFPEPDYDVIMLAGVSGPIVAVYKMRTRSNLGSQLEGQFPIPLRARFMQVVNNLALATANTHALFNLGL